MLEPSVSRPRTAARRRNAPVTPERRPIPIASPATTEARRPLLLLMTIVVIAAGLTARLVFWQVLQAPHLSRLAHQEQAALIVQPAQRGQILDSSGNPLATDVPLDLVYAVPRDIKDPGQDATLLAPLLGVPEKTLDQELSSFSVYQQLAPRVSSDVSTKIRALHLPGIFLEPEMQRDYPDGSLASQVLGFTNTDGQGNYGVEGKYDTLLSGKAGLRSILHDASGGDIQLSSAPPAPSHAGATLTLSLNSVVQNVAETELQTAVKKHRADGGTVIVMDPRTGFILGMAGTPTYDPNRFARYDYSRYQNPAIQWGYEPGSTFKIITMAAGLDAHVITPTTSFFDSGAFTVSNVTLHNWNLQGFGTETMTQVLQHSANVGAAWVSSRLGMARFYEYVKRFRIGRPTGIDLFGEEPGILPLPGQKNWTIVNQFTNAFGQGLLTTPLQMIRAVAAVANGGVMMKPQIVHTIALDGRIVTHKPVRVGRVIAPDSARTLTGMLVQSAIGGEAQLGLVKGYNIAAKTGTANIASPTGGYIQGATIASIVGYAPAFHPRFVVLVIINHPRDTLWGSEAAAPVLHNIFQELFMYYHVPPSSHAVNQ